VERSSSVTQGQHHPVESTCDTLPYIGASPRHS